MNSLVDTINQAAGSWWPHLWHATWQASLVAAVVLITVRLGRRWRAQLRYALLLVALAKFAIPPMLAMPTGLFTHFGPTVTDRTALPIAASQAGDEAYAGATGASAETGLADITWRGWAMLIHAAGIAAVSLWGLSQLARIVVLTRRGRVVGDGPLYHQMNRLARQMRLLRRVRLMVTTDAVPPMAFGILRPTVLLPVGVLAGLSKAQTRTVLAHELAHHRRNDLWMNWLQLVLTAVWWFNPLIWTLNRVVRRTREDCCDDLLLSRRLAHNETYCQTLLCVARNLSGAALLGGATGFAERFSPLGGRIRRIMNPHVSRSTGLSWAVVPAILLAVLVLPGLRGVSLASEDAPGVSPSQQAGHAADAKPQPGTPATSTPVDGQAGTSDAQPTDRADRSATPWLAGTTLPLADQTPTSRRGLLDPGPTIWHAPAVGGPIRQLLPTHSLYGQAPRVAGRTTPSASPDWHVPTTTAPETPTTWRWGIGSPNTIGGQARTGVLPTPMPAGSVSSRRPDRRPLNRATGTAGNIDPNEEPESSETVESPLMSMPIAPSPFEVDPAHLLKLIPASDLPDANVAPNASTIGVIDWTNSRTDSASLGNDVFAVTPFDNNAYTAYAGVVACSSSGSMTSFSLATGLELREIQETSFNANLVDFAVPITPATEYLRRRDGLYYFRIDGDVRRYRYDGTTLLPAASYPPLPEPATALLFGIGAVALLRRRRR